MNTLVLYSSFLHCFREEPADEHPSRSELSLSALRSTTIGLGKGPKLDAMASSYLWGSNSNVYSRRLPTLGLAVCSMPGFRGAYLAYPPDVLPEHCAHNVRGCLHVFRML